MDEREAWRILEEERLEFAEVLDELTPEQWDTQSLCSAWTVAGVTTHMMVGQTGSLLGFATAMAKARGSFARANQIMVERKLDRPRGQIAADFREYAGHRFTPPGFGWQAPLTDFLVHRLDALVPLGIDAGGAPDTWAPALDLLISPKARRALTEPGLPALRFVATDLGTAVGTGPEVEGPVEALALAITRRPTDRLEELDGPGADVLRAWAQRESPRESLGE